jgi:hypothetical protein
MVESGGTGLPAFPVTGAGRVSSGGGGASAGFGATDVIPGALAGFGAGAWPGVTWVDREASARPFDAPGEGGAAGTPVDEGADEVGGTVGGAGAGSAALAEGGCATVAALPVAGATSSPTAGALGASSRVARKAPSPRTTTRAAATPIQRDDLPGSGAGAAAGTPTADRAGASAPAVEPVPDVVNG